MLLYSKLHDLMTSMGTLNGRSGLKCKVKELYGRNDELRFVYFTTEYGTPCLLNLSKHDIKTDEKFFPLSRWRENDVDFEAVLAADPEISIVKEVRATSSPTSFIDLVKRLEPSLKSIPYKVAILSREYLITLDDYDVDVFYINGPTETTLLVVLDLKTLLFKNSIPELERVYQNILTLIHDYNDMYWVNLLDLLKKCNQMKIVTNGKRSITTHNLIDQSMKISMSHKAVKMALQCCFPT